MLAGEIQCPKWRYSHRVRAFEVPCRREPEQAAPIHGPITGQHRPPALAPADPDTPQCTHHCSARTTARQAQGPGPKPQTIVTVRQLLPTYCTAICTSASTPHLPMSFIMQRFSSRPRDHTLTIHRPAHRLLLSITRTVSHKILR